MDKKFSYLEKFREYCENEEAYQEEIAPFRGEANFNRIMRELERSRAGDNNGELQQKLKKAQQILNGCTMVHVTTLDGLLGIIRDDNVYCGNHIEETAMDFFKYSYSPATGDYVSCGLEKGHPVYGMYQLRFSSGIEKLPGAKFIPRASTCYEHHEIQDYIMDLRFWKEYLSQFLAVNHKQMEEYFDVVPYHHRPEFLFYHSIPLSYVEEIFCTTEKAFTELKSCLSAKNLLNENLLSKLKIAVL